MIKVTLTVAEVARQKGVSEAAVRAALTDPNNKTLLGVKVGGQLLIFEESLQSYTPRNYPRKHDE